MDLEKEKVLKELFEKLYKKENREQIELMVLQLKSTLENLAGVNAFITARVKSPISIIKKFESPNENYTEKWNNMRDLVGLMVVVDKNSDVDDIIFHLENEYANLKNPNAKKLYKDFRVKNIRKDQIDKDGEKDSDYDPPTDKGYQICDGYKNVRVNLMINDYPIEIQIKTKEQYVAHEATHDPVYKAPSLKDPIIRQMISDKLFPYFEINAHKMFHASEMSDRELEIWQDDVLKIEDRNKDVYEEYIDIYQDACRVYAYYLFMTNNMKKIYKDAAFGNDALNLKLLEIEVKRTFHYLEKEISSENTSLMSGEVFNMAIKRIAKMSFEEFNEMREKIAGSYRCEKCVVSGVYDLLRGKDVELFRRLSDSFRNVEVAVYDDQLAEIFTGKKPLFSLKERQSSLRNIKGISSITTIDINGKTSSANALRFMSLNSDEDRKFTVNPIPIGTEQLLKPRTSQEIKGAQIKLPDNTFAIGYLPGVFDMLHPENIEYISEVCRICKNVYVGSKSDQYVQIIKGEDPVLEFDERIKVLKALRGIADVVNTEFDITPPKEILELMDQKIKDGSRCAIFMGSTWIENPGSKNMFSIREYENLIKRHPDISLISVPRENRDRAGLKYKNQAIENREADINPYEFTIFDR